MAVVRSGGGVRTVKGRRLGGGGAAVHSRPAQPVHSAIYRICSFCAALIGHCGKNVTAISAYIDAIEGADIAVSTTTPPRWRFPT